LETFLISYQPISWPVLQTQNQNQEKEAEKYIFTK